jgi:hypothetical protein
MSALVRRVKGMHMPNWAEGVHMHMVSPAWPLGVSETVQRRWLKSAGPGIDVHCQ